MKKFIQLLLKKRFKFLKSKRGFSLIEVLVAVAIIGIISAIAVPQFVAQRENAARVAADTSATNIVKAFRQCRVLKPFGDCDTIGEIDMTCPSGSTCGDEDDSPKFCAHILNGDDASNPDFSVCVSVNGSSETRTYGGTLLQNNKICHFTVVDDGNGGCVGNDLGVKQVKPVRLCTDDDSCGTAGTATGHANCTKTVGSEACTTATTVGKCNSSADCT